MKEREALHHLVDQHLKIEHSCANVNSVSSCIGFGIIKKPGMA